MANLLVMSAKNPISSYKIMDKFFRAVTADPTTCKMLRVDDKPQLLTSSELGDYIESDARSSGLVLTADPGNCHTFVETDKSGRDWFMFSANIVSGGKPVDNKLFADFLHMVNSRMENDYHNIADMNPDKRERFNWLESKLMECSGNTHMRLMLFDRQLMYVYSNIENAMFYCKDDAFDVSLVSTNPFGDFAWDILPAGKLCAFENGRCALHSYKKGRTFLDFGEAV